jgi:hypothetical protein
MKINSLCEIFIIYNAILDFFIDTGYGEKQDLTPHPAFIDFIDSYSKFDSLISYWEEKGMLNCTNPKIK